MIACVRNCEEPEVGEELVFPCIKDTTKLRALLKNIKKKKLFLLSETRWRCS